MSQWAKMRSFFLSDEELGKKDDDHNTKPFPNNGGVRPSKWNPAARVPPRRSLKRIALVLLVAAGVYLFFKNIPVLGPHQGMRRPNYVYPDSSSTLHKRPSNGEPARIVTNSHVSNTPERTYNGPVKFHDLAASLHAIAGTRGGSMVNRNILFAASSLKSAATLLPIACQMAAELKNYVHFALLSRSDIDVEELRSVNGIDDSCQIIFHDARPDYALVSTEDRMENAVFRSLYHINTYMHPQAIMIDGSDEEEGFFARAVRQHVKGTRTTLVELPLKSAKSLEWMSRLDSASLRLWDKNHIDILIQATPGASGGLIRLLRSLSAADYTSSSVPHLTIDLPHDVDPPTKQFLETFTWPPSHVYNPTNARYLSLRHRIPHQRLTEEESSARFLESFWPAQPEHSHILVLSPQVEVSPNFFHYLKYSLLEYRYSTMAAFQLWDRRLFGISLEQPLRQLNGESFSPPTLKNPDSENPAGEEMSTPFLWQAPTSNAVLFLGEKWMELHDFVSRSLEAKEGLETVPELLSEKMIGKHHPSWLEHALRLCRVRGYWLLYPGQDTARNLATVHNELSRLPEEYAGEERSKSLLTDGASDEEIDNVRQKLRLESEITLAPRVSLLESLSNDGNLRPIGDLPILTWDGRTTDLDVSNSLAAAYESEFKEKVGSCDVEAPEELIRVREKLSAQDLFCATV